MWESRAILRSREGPFFSAKGHFGSLRFSGWQRPGNALHFSPPSDGFSENRVHYTLSSKVPAGGWEVLFCDPLESSRQRISWTWQRGDRVNRCNGGRVPSSSGSEDEGKEKNPFFFFFQSRNIAETCRILLWRVWSSETPPTGMFGCSSFWFWEHLVRSPHPRDPLRKIFSPEKNR